MNRYYRVYPNAHDGGKTYGLILRGGPLVCPIYRTDSGGQFEGFFSRSTAYRRGKKWVDFGECFEGDYAPSGSGFGVHVGGDEAAKSSSKAIR